MQRSLNELNSRERRARAADASTPSGQLPADWICGRAVIDGRGRRGKTSRAVAAVRRVNGGAICTGSNRMIVQANISPPLHPLGIFLKVAEIVMGIGLIDKEFWPFCGVQIPGHCKI